MASISFAGLVIGIVIVSFYSACAHEVGGKKGKWLAGFASENHASSRNVLGDDISAASTAGNVAGRKMRVDELLKGESERKHGLKRYDRSKAHVFLEQQKQKSNSHQDAPKAFLDAADEVVNLMGKDYSGKLDRPHQKPPIHNHETTD